MNIIAVGYKDSSNGLYKFGENITKTNVIESFDEASLWHMRLGHLNYQSLSFFFRSNEVTGMPNIKVHHEICEGFLVGHQHRERFPKKFENRASELCEKIHSKLVGPMLQMSLGGSHYILVFIDDYSQKNWTYFQKNKDQTFDIFKIMKERVESKTRNKIRCLRTDFGREYISTEFKKFCEDHGIHRELIEVLIPQQNGMVERRNRTIIEKVRSLVHDCNLLIFLWSEAVFTTNHLINRSLTHTNFGIIPEAKYACKSPSIDNLHIFGCILYAHVPKKDRNKLKSKTIKCLFVSYDKQNKVYRLYNLQKQKIVLNRDVIFDQNSIQFHLLSENITFSKDPFPVGSKNRSR